MLLLESESMRSVATKHDLFDVIDNLYKMGGARIQGLLKQGLFQLLKTTEAFAEPFAQLLAHMIEPKEGSIANTVSNPITLLENILNEIGDTEPKNQI